MRYSLVLVIAILCNSPVRAQEFDGICRLSTTAGVQFSGVAVSDTTILTVAHHDTAVGGTILVELPEGKHSSRTRLKLHATVQKLDTGADLCLLQFSMPKWATVRPYRVAHKATTADTVVIRGYITESPMQLTPTLIRRGDILQGRDTLVDAYYGQAIVGMSGALVTAVDSNELIGIQLGGDPALVHVITLPTIHDFYIPDVVPATPAVISQ